MAVNCTSAGLPHHSQRLPRGAESTATGWRNSFFDIRYPPSSCYWLVKNNVTNTYQGKPVSSGQRLWRVHDDTANPENTHHRPGAASLPPLNYMEKCTATCLSPGRQSMYLHYSTFSRNAPVKSRSLQGFSNPGLTGGLFHLLSLADECASAALLLIALMKTRPANSPASGWVASPMRTVRIPP
jgi:hypothetical protein